ncbi:hypothetical protein KKF84_08285, partial [Myxococcota bacterium]|nr:hypothetical protein [Myxococcota bacterium]MBU1535306.1 hypothetical protein [Myxococcota bacterium]
PANPHISFEVARQENIVYGGLQAKGDILVTSHFEPMTQNPGSVFENMVLFYMDRFDLSDASAPNMLAPVNIPGSLVDYNPNNHRIVTVDYVLGSLQTPDENVCYMGGHYNIWYDYDLGHCFWLDRTLDILNLVGNHAVLASVKNYSEGYLASVKATDSRIFVQLNSGYYYWYYDGVYEEQDPRPLLKTIEIGGLFSYPTTSTVRMPAPWSTLQAASGTSAVVTGSSPPSLAVYDASDPYNVEVSTETLLTGYSYGIEMDPDRIISANSMWGVQVIPY